MDACAIAAVGAAKSFCRPQYRLRDESYSLDDPYKSGAADRAMSEGQSSGIVPLAEREGLKLTVHHTPFTVSFVAFKKSTAKAF